MKRIFYSDRHFLLNDYYMSHSQLLIRSLATDDAPYNIDLVFKAVFIVSMIPRYTGLAIDLLDSSDDMDGEVEARLRISRPRHGKIFVLRSGDRADVIGASSFHESKNTLAPNETSIDIAQDLNRDVFVIRDVDTVSDERWRVSGEASASIKVGQVVRLRNGPEDYEGFMVVGIEDERHQVQETVTGRSYDLILTNVIGKARLFTGPPRLLARCRALLSEAAR
jgi:hypothetical protein